MTAWNSQNLARQNKLFDEPIRNCAVLAALC
jgi:hypothetical protein